MKDLMIDLETLGTEPGCIILSIGACFFDRNTGKIGNTLYREISTHNSKEIGLTADKSTLEWWEQQDQEAKALLDRCNNYDMHTPLAAAIIFIGWLNTNKPEDIKGIWANDPTFDLKALEHMIKLTGNKPQFEFRYERSCRTIVDIGRELGIDPKKDLPFSGTQHNALDDAIHQAKYVSAIYQHINALKKS